MKNLIFFFSFIVSTIICQSAAPTPIQQLVIPSPNGTAEVQSGGTLTIDSGATIINNGTATGFGAATSVPLSGITGLGTGVQTALGNPVQLANGPVVLDSGGNLNLAGRTIAAVEFDGIATQAITAYNALAVPWSGVTGTPTTLAGYGITDPIVLTSGSYANPSWITSLAGSKLTGTITATAMPWSGLTGTAPNLSVFSATTSAQLLGVISDETGTGSLVFGTSPSLVTPTINGNSIPSTSQVVTVNNSSTSPAYQLTAPVAALFYAANPAPLNNTGSGVNYSVLTYAGNSATAPKVNAVFSGDSITAGDGLGDSFPLQITGTGFGNNLTVWNAGASGLTAIQINSILNTSQAYVGTPSAGTFNALSKLSSGTYFIEGAGTNDLSAICGEINQVSTTGNTNGTNIITGLGTTSGAVSGDNVIANWKGTYTTDGTNFSDGELCVIGTRTYRFKNTPAAFNDIQIGASAAASLTNLYNAVSFTNISGFFAGTPVNFEVQALSVTTTIMVIQGYNPFLTTGLATTSTASHASWGATTLAGGGIIPSGTTVSSIDSSSQVHISNAATGTVTGANISFATESLAQWKTAEQAMWTAARSAGAQVVRWSILPRSDTTPSVINNTLAASTWTAMNAWLAQQKYDGVTVTSGWDAYADLSANSELSSISNASVWTFANANKGIHPNQAGKQLLANAISNTALTLFSGSNTYNVFPFSYKGIENLWLQSDVALTDVANSWASLQSFATIRVGQNGGGPIQLGNPFGQSAQIQAFSDATFATKVSQLTMFTDGSLSLGSTVTNGASLNISADGKTFNLTGNNNPDTLFGSRGGFHTSTDVFRTYFECTANGGQVWEFGNNNGTAQVRASSTGLNGGQCALQFLGSSNAVTGSEFVTGYVQVDVLTASTMVKADSNKRLVSATAGTDYQAPLTFSTGLTNTTGTVTVNTSQNIGTLSNLTSNGFVKTSGGTGALSVDTTTYAASHAAGTPTIAIGTGASGTGSSISIAGSDVSGAITVTAGVGAATSATVCTVTFHTAYGVAPNCVIVAPGNSSAALLNGVTMVYSSAAGVTTTTFTITSGTTALTAATTYVFNYMVPQQ